MDEKNCSVASAVLPCCECSAITKFKASGQARTCLSHDMHKYTSIVKN